MGCRRCARRPGHCTSASAAGTCILRSVTRLGAQVQATAHQGAVLLEPGLVGVKPLEPATEMRGGLVAVPAFLMHTAVGGDSPTFEVGITGGQAWAIPHRGWDTHTTYWTRQHASRDRIVKALLMQQSPAVAAEMNGPGDRRIPVASPPCAHAVAGVRVSFQTCRHLPIVLEGHCIAFGRCIVRSIERGVGRDVGRGVAIPEYAPEHTIIDIDLIVEWQGAVTSPRSSSLPPAPGHRNQMCATSVRAQLTIGTHPVT